MASSRTARTTQQLAVSRFKAECLKVVESVRTEGREYLITKHGKIVARLVPAEDAARQSPRGAWRGRISIEGDIVQCDWSQEFEATRS